MTALLKQKEKNMKAIQPEDQGYWLFTKGSTLYWQENDLPFGTAKELGLTTQKAMLLGKWKSQPLWLVAENDQDEREYLSLRSLLSLPTEDFHLLSRGVEINHFLKTHQFCGKCGQKAEQTHDELAVQCTNCGYRTYPVICPSIIVAVRRGTEILLANHKRHYTPGKAGIYTTLAGFVEVGETFEDAVHREFVPLFDRTSRRIGGFSKND